MEVVMKLERIQYALTGENGSRSYTISCEIEGKGRIAEAGDSIDGTLWQMFARNFPELNGFHLAKNWCGIKNGESCANVCLSSREKTIYQQGRAKDSVEAMALAIIQGILEIQKR